MEITIVAKKKRSPATPKEASRRNKNMVRMSDEDHEMLTELADRHGRKITAENHQALLEYFQKHGMLPKQGGANAA